MFEGSGRVSIRIDGKVVFRKGSNQKVRGSFELPLVKGQEYQVEVEACGMKAQQTVRLSWRPPFDDHPRKVGKRIGCGYFILEGRQFFRRQGPERLALGGGSNRIDP